MSAEFGLQKMGEVESSLSVTLPVGVNAAQAAEDIVGASSQHLGGITGFIGGVGSHAINHRIDFRLGAGISVGKNDHRIIINGEEFDNDEISKAAYLKFGFGIKLTTEFEITTHAERYFFDNPIDRYSIGLIYTY